MDDKKKHYAAFGLGITSEIDLPELLPAADLANVQIRLGKTPGHLETPEVKTPWYEAAPGRFLLRVDGIAAYYVENGNRIVIEPNPKTRPENIRVFLLNTVLAVLLHQRDYLVLHGAVAVVDGKAVALVGHSGVGKTAIALTLFDRGYEILGDEICAIKLQDGKPVVVPGIPQLNVWRDTLEKAGKDMSNYRPIREGIEKYVFPVKERFGGEPTELGRIVLLATHNRPEIESAPVKGGACFEKLMRNAYCLETAMNKTEHFRISAAVVNQALIRQVTFIQHPYQVDQVTDFILGEVNR
jgi:hypothetical protein